jgi:Rrf2 family protein
VSEATPDTGIAEALWKTAIMRVSAKADYALRALIEMAARVEGPEARPVSAEELGRLQDIPHNFLQAILADLRKAGIVHAQRGQAGGWRLAKPASDVSVADVIRAVDGPLVSVYGLRPEAVSYNARAETLQRVWIAARHSLRTVFEHVTVADLASGSLPAGVAAHTEDEDAWQPH